jgi:hypothetical protein
MQSHPCGLVVGPGAHQVSLGGLDLLEKTEQVQVCHEGIVVARAPVAGAHGGRCDEALESPVSSLEGQDERALLDLVGRVKVDEPADGASDP